MENTYKLIDLKKEHIEILYQWRLNEKDYDHYTCRPIKKMKPFNEYAINIRKLKIAVLVDEKNENIPLGKITLFDYNPRNYSAEFGYYLLSEYRNKGLGGIMIKEFLSISFTNNNLMLNKLYATTASNNVPSIKLLEKFNFKLDGKLREHYYINNIKYDQLIYSLLKSEWNS